MQNVTSVSIECTFGCQKVNQAARLADIDHQRHHRAAVAQEPNDNGAVDDGLQIAELQQVEQEARETCWRPTR